MDWPRGWGPLLKLVTRGYSRNKALLSQTWRLRITCNWGSYLELSSNWKLCGKDLDWPTKRKREMVQFVWTKDHTSRTLFVPHCCIRSGCFTHNKEWYCLSQFRWRRKLMTTPWALGERAVPGSVSNSWNNLDGTPTWCHTHTGHFWAENSPWEI